NKGGIENVELLTREPFNKTFTDWATAILLSGTGKNSRFDFKSVDLHRSYGGIELSGVNLSNSVIEQLPSRLDLNINNWSVNYTRLNNLQNQEWNLRFKNQGNAQVSANLVSIR